MTQRLPLFYTLIMIRPGLCGRSRLVVKMLQNFLIQKITILIQFMNYFLTICKFSNPLAASRLLAAKNKARRSIELLVFDCSLPLFLLALRIQ